MGSLPPSPPFSTDQQLQGLEVLWTLEVAALPLLSLSTLSHGVALSLSQHSRGNYCLLSMHPSEDSEPRGLVPIRDMLTEQVQKGKVKQRLSPPQQGQSFPDSRAAHVRPGETGEPQRTWAGATPEGVGSGSTPKAFRVCMNG